MEAIQSKLLNLTDFRISPQLIDIFSSVKEKYPHAYGTRSTVENAMPRLIGAEKEKGILYEILQENKDHYAHKHFVLWRKDESDYIEMYHNSLSASLQTKKGLYFIDKQHSPGASISLVDIDVWQKSPHIEYVLSLESMRPEYRLESITRIVEGKECLFVEGIEGSGKTYIGFLEATGKGYSLRIKMLNLPEWVDVSTWQPGIDKRVIYFSDDRSIYAFPIDDQYHDSVTEEYHLAPGNFFGQTHSWEYNPLYSKFVINTLGKNGGTPHFSDGQKLPEEIIQYPWIFCGEGVIYCFHNACHEVEMYYVPLNVKRYEQKLIAKISQVWTKPKFVFEDKTMFYLQVHYQWHVITWEDVKRVIR